jgi:predicted RNA-binding Zn-ribbon protein involved in translation (DUF1610 family)
MRKVIRLTPKQLRSIISEVLSTNALACAVNEAEVMKPKKAKEMKCPGCGEVVQPKGRGGDGIGHRYQCDNCDTGWET